MNRTVLLSLFFVAFSGCGTSVEHVARTQSDRPEVIIKSRDADLVESAIIHEMQAVDFFLQEDSKYRLVFTKQMKGGQAILAQVAIGDAYSTTPVMEISFNITRLGKRIKVTGYSSISTCMAYGQVNRVDMKDNDAWFTDIQLLLQRVKAKVEGE